MGEIITVTISTGMFRAHELPEGLRVSWSEFDTEQVSHAEKVFKSYIKEGWIAFSEVGKEKRQIMRFDPKLNKIVMLPPLGGG
jgi:hypothetical protein